MTKPRDSKLTVKEGLRARQRRLGHDTILDTAFELLKARGYSKTTIQMIADHAGVGVATVFRHFQSKPGVVAALMRRDVEVILERGDELIANPGDDPVQAMMEFLLLMLTAWDVPITRVRGLSRLWLALPTGHRDADAMVRWADAKLLSMIQRLLEHFRTTGRLAQNLDVAGMSAVAFAVFNHHFIRLATGDEPSLTEAKADLRSHVPLLFANWLSPTKPRSVKRRGGARLRAPAKR